MKRKCMIAAYAMILVVTTATGCGSKQNTDNGNSLPATETQDIERAKTANTESSDSLPVTEVQDTEKEDTENTIADTDTSSIIDMGDNQNSMFIGGKVRSVTQDGFVLSRVRVEDSYVIMPETGSPDEELVTVIYTDSTIFEYWIIQGSGGDIIMNEATSSDVVQDGGLEVSGYFSGEEFIAEKVIIETYE